MNGPPGLMGEAIRLHQAGRLADAARLYRRVLSHSPHPQAFSNLGAALRGLGRLDEATSSYRQAILLQPDFADAYANYANLAKQCDPPDQAVPLYRRAMALKPGDAGLHYNLGLTWQERGRPVEAIEAYLGAVTLHPFFPGAWNNLASAFADLNHLENALQAVRRAIVLKPDMAQSYSQLGLALQDRGDPGPAIAAFERGQVLQPNQAEGHSNRLLAELYRPGVTPADLARLTPFRPSPAAAAPRRSSLRRLGFVSGDFRRHAVGFMVLPALEALARQGYEIVCYSTAPRGDTLTDRFRAAGRWRDVRALDDDRLEAQIRTDGIDILFDLSGHSRGNRLSLFTRRAAPLQIAWAGFPAGTGVGAMDYLLTDRWQTPAGTDGFYGEKLLRLPHSYVVFEPPAGLPEPGPLPADLGAGVTFASFNALKKINDGVIALWSRILRTSPEARLLLKTPAFDCPATIAHIARRFAAAGIAPAQLRFLGRSSPEDHAAAMAEADIALDPFPYSGGMTSLESLWMGLPVITWPGETLAGRHAYGYLKTLGLEETIAADEEDYAALAVALACDLPRLATLRAGMRARMRASPLMDRDGFAADLSTLLETAWRQRGLDLNYA